MLADAQSSFPVEALLTAINSVAILLGAIFAWWANRNRKADSVKNSTAIVAVHEVARTDTPSQAPQRLVAADKAVAALPVSPSNTP